MDRTMIVISSRGKKVPITIIGDLMAVAMLPLFFWNCIAYFVEKVILPVYSIIVFTPIALVINIMSRLRLLNLPFLLVLCFLASCATLAITEYLNLDNIVGYVASGITLTLSLSSLYVFDVLKAQTFRTDLLTGFSTLQREHELYAPCRTPRVLVIDRRTINELYFSHFLSFFALFNLVIIYCSSLYSVSFWISFHAFFSLLFTNNFEMIEHLASHSKKGKLIARVQNTDIRYYSGFAVLILVMELVRKYLIWPLFFWFPNAYFVTHAQHHHAENSGPADWQSMLRYDKTSALDFTKAINWFSLNTFFPLDSFRYFIAVGRKKTVAALVKSVVLGYVAIACLIFLLPQVGITLVVLLAGVGFSTYSFAFGWHGFHDSKEPYDVKASNNSNLHFAHHAKPGVHLYSLEMIRLYKNRFKQKDDVVTYSSEDAFDIVSGNVFLVHVLLWSREYAAIRNLMHPVSMSDAELADLVKGMGYGHTCATVRAWDLRVSKYLGRILSPMLFAFLSKKHKSIIFANKFQKESNSGMI